MINWPAKAQPSIRSIGAERSADCAAIHATSFAHPWAEADFEQLFTTPGIFADGAITPKEKNLAGFILSRLAAEEAEILTLAVAPEWRRRGIATSLLGPHLASLANLQVARLFLEVNVENIGARALYAHFGFEPVGERQAYFRTAGDGRATALVMRRDLL
ncbi:MAG: GNAT family N-acetyltransferase [Alphaproteobacteria bacterium]|nr:GNAT family N-acetyltransferase [Alphaproteobacteria bacterium]MCL2453578.1 GNAT family N-acetyltransferase [Alphaproteobacteria bacterium]